jgi:hypothetical protein
VTLAAQINRAGGLLSAADLARDWNLTRQRLTVLQRAEGFPEPVGTVNGRPVWAGNDAREWRDNQLKGKKS